jgi:hypothetical protein
MAGIGVSLMVFSATIASVLIISPAIEARFDDAVPHLGYRNVHPGTPLGARACCAMRLMQMLELPGADDEAGRTDDRVSSSKRRWCRIGLSVAMLPTGGSLPCMQ